MSVIKRDTAASYNCMIHSGFRHLSNIRLSEFDNYRGSRYQLGKPKAAAAYTSDQLFDMGIYGVYELLNSRMYSAPSDAEKTIIRSLSSRTATKYAVTA